MKLLKMTIILISTLVVNITPAKAVEVVYSLSDLAGCEVVGHYKKSMRNKSSKKKMEKKLMAMAAKDGATHVYVTKYIDNTKKGKGIKAKAEGRKCD